MKNNLPDKITLKDGTVLTPYIGHLKNKDVVTVCNQVGARYKKVEVLSRNLRGKTDLHGNPYKPSVWIFTNLDNQ